MSTNLRYFKSVKVPDNLLEVFRAIEDILQQEHGVDGGHRLATSSQSGMLSAEDKKKLDGITGGTTSPQSSTVTVTVPPGDGGGTTGGDDGVSDGTFNFQHALYTGVNNSTGVTFAFTNAYASINLYTCHITCSKGDAGSFRNVGYKRTKTISSVTVIPVEADATVEIICYAIPS